jgi:hypothetical protein
VECVAPDDGDSIWVDVVCTASTMTLSSKTLLVNDSGLALCILHCRPLMHHHAAQWQEVICGVGVRSASMVVDKGKVKGMWSSLLLMMTPTAHP